MVEHYHIHRLRRGIYPELLVKEGAGMSPRKYPDTVDRFVGVILVNLPEERLNHRILGEKPERPKVNCDPSNIGFDWIKAQTAIKDSIRLEKEMLLAAKEERKAAKECFVDLV